MSETVELIYKAFLRHQEQTGKVPTATELSVVVHRTPGYVTTVLCHLRKSGRLGPIERGRRKPKKYIG